MKKTTRIGQKGFSIAELLIVLAVVFVLATAALVTLDSSKKKLQMQNIAREFKVYLERARFDSVKRSAEDTTDMAKVVLHSPTSFSANTDYNQDGKLDTSETRDIDFSYQKDVKFLSASTVFPVFIYFNNRGQIKAVDGDGNSIIPTFIICEKNCEEVDSQPATFQIVSLSPTGTVTILNGGELMETAKVPDAAEINSSSGIDPLVSTIPNDGSIIDVILGK